MSKPNNRKVAQLKKLFVSLVVLLIFILPMLSGALWAHQLINNRDKRKTFSQAEIDNFATNCSLGERGDLTPFKEPLITITFDDGWESVYSAGFEELERACIKSTQYILGDNYEDYNYLSKKQVHSMQDAGHEIASHTMSHPNLTSLSQSDLVWELSESKRLLNQEYGVVSDLASPLGATNDSVIEEIKKYYRSHRNTNADPAVADDTDINTKTNFNFYQINAYTVRQSTTDNDLKRLINYTKKRGGWLILTYHQIDDSGAYYGVSKQTLKRHLQLVKESGMKTPTLGAVLKAIEARKR